MKRWLIIVVLVVTSPIWIIAAIPYWLCRYGRNYTVAMCVGWKLLSVMSVPQDLWRFHDGSRPAAGMWLP